MRGDLRNVEKANVCVHVCFTYCNGHKNGIRGIRKERIRDVGC